MSAAQWEQLRSHPEAGLKLLESLPISQTVKDVVLNHHERFNGEGFPAGLKGREIPLAARLVAVAENYVSMLTSMPQRPALSEDQAKEILGENFGQRYDPDIVQVFLRMLEGGELKDESEPKPVPA
jgi:HD-GYP domain-containing protein (c-di-GMP phosphodiesterase class II)